VPLILIKPPIKNIYDPAAFGLLFITVFRFNIDNFPGYRYYGLWTKFIKHCEYYLKKGNHRKCIKNRQIISIEPNSFNIIFYFIIYIPLFCRHTHVLFRWRGDRDPGSITWFMVILTFRLPKFRWNEGYILLWMTTSMGNSAIFANFIIASIFFIKLDRFFVQCSFILMQLWAISGGIIVYLAAKNMEQQECCYCRIGFIYYLISYQFALFWADIFSKMGEVISIESTNILISSFLVLAVYFLFRDMFSPKIAIFASFFTIFATPISFYSITLKHHSLTVLLTLLAFYCFYKYQEKRIISSFIMLMPSLAWASGLVLQKGLHLWCHYF